MEPLLPSVLYWSIFRKYIIVYQTIDIGLSSTFFLLTGPHLITGETVEEGDNDVTQKKALYFFRTERSWDRAKLTS